MKNFSANLQMGLKNKKKSQYIWLAKPATSTW